MKSKKNKKTVITGLTSALLVQAVVPVVAAEDVSPVSSTNNEVDIPLSIQQEQKIDVTLTVGDSNVDATNFQQDLIKSLVERGINPENVNIDAIETSAISTNDANAQSIFNDWERFPYNYNGGETLWRYDNASKSLVSDVNPAFETGFINNVTGITNNFSLQSDVFINEPFQPIGFIFGMKPNEKDTKRHDLYYLWLSTDTEARETVVAFFKVEGQNFDFQNRLSPIGTNLAKEGTYSATPLRPYSGSYFGWPNHAPVNYGGFPHGTPQQKGLTVSNDGDPTMKTTILDFVKIPIASGWKNLKLTVEDNKFDVTLNNENLLSYVDTNNPYLNGYHGIFQYSHVGPKFTNVKINSRKELDFNEVLQGPKWRENAAHFVVNLNDEETADLDDTHKSGQILSRLMNEDVHYVGLGTDANKGQTERFVAKNSGQGTFIDNKDYAASIEQLADYIATELEKNVQTVSNDHPYVLRDTPIRFNHDEVSGSNWTLTHDDTHFENSEGTSLLDGLSLSQLPTSLDKTGAYQVKYGEQTIAPQTIYAHRLPTAVFTMQHDKSEDGSTTITTTDLSYDVDHLSTENKGIVERKWRWKETSATEWNEGELPTNLPEGKHYLLQLQVKDVEGEWSLPVTNYVTTDPTAETTPIANFTLPQKHDVAKELSILDHSYDPAGHALTTTNWVVYKNGAKIYTGTTPITDFTQYGVGTYAYELTVTNALGNKSETFTRQVEVHEPNYTKAKEQMELVTKGILDGTTNAEDVKEILGQTEGLVNELIDTGNKTDGQNALAELNKVLVALEAVEKAEGVKPLSSQSKIDTVKDLIATAKPLVNVLTDGEAKTSLDNRLKALEAKLVDAENNLIQVEIPENAEPSFVGLSWQPFDEFDGTGTLDYKIVVKQYDEATDTFVNSTFDRSSKTTDIDIKGLTPGTYEFSVYPRKNGVVISDEPIGMVVVDIPEPTEPAAPTVQNVVATGVDATTATITWDAFEGAKRYRVQYYVQDPLTGEFVKEGYGRTTTTPSLTINTLSEGRTYKFDVTPYVTKFDDANKGDSNVITLTVPVVEAPPVVENRLHVEAINETTANLSWEQLEGEDRYRVQLYVKNSSGVFEKEGFARAIPETTFAYSGLTPGLEYKFEVVPRVGYKYDESKAFTETMVMPSKEEPPVTTENKQLENLVVNMQGKTAELSWDTLNIDGESVTAYRVERYVKDDLTGQYKWELTRTAVGTNYLDTYNLHSGKTYHYEIIPRVGFVYDQSYKTTSPDIVNP